MSENADAVFVGMTGDIWAAPEGTAIPAALGAPADPWVMLGYLSEDGVTLTPGLTTEDIRVWQSTSAIRRLVTERALDIGFALRQWDANTIPFAFGGGTIDAATGIFTYDGPDPEELDYRALLVEVRDGDKTTRLYVAKGMVSDLGDAQFVRNAAADLQVTFSALEPGGGGRPATMVSDDPAWDPAAAAALERAIAKAAAKDTKAA
jgi:hypothetical protein